MSRHTFQHNGKTVVVGFDPPLETFFAQVWIDLNDKEPLESYGGFPKEIPSTARLEAALGFLLGPEMCGKLESDKAGAPAPSALQRRMVEWVDEQFGQLKKGD